MLYAVLTWPLLTTPLMGNLGRPSFPSVYSQWLQIAPLSFQRLWTPLAMLNAFPTSLTCIGSLHGSPQKAPSQQLLC